jgi:hypothetical protein
MAPSLPEPAPEINQPLEAGSDVFSRVPAGISRLRARNMYMVWPGADDERAGE